MSEEEGCFLACTFWVVEAHALHGDLNVAQETFLGAVDGLQRGAGIYPEMVSPQTGQYLGNLPQALTHLALIGAANTLTHCMEAGRL